MSVCVIGISVKFTYAQHHAHVLMVYIVSRINVDDCGFLVKKCQTRHFEAKICLTRA